MFGTCYYPEHWSQEQWAEDARMMSELGLSYVRIGEFSWSRLEPREGELNFQWLDEAIKTLSNAGLKIIIGTPTATPPKWLVDKWPDVLPVDPQSGQVRGFGSRRHYDFSSEIYLREALRITELLAERYGSNDAVVGWQTDNELCCHETCISASKAALDAFRNWCKGRYGTIEKLNSAWGNVFWSMEYMDFSDIELPFSAVTEVNPAHALAYRRFSSDQAVRFHNQMIEVIREKAPGKFITHNFIPMDDTGTDNFALAENLDFASYDNYPLGRTDEQLGHLPKEGFQPYMRTGHPDFATYYHDQVRGLKSKDFWIMEQQPGPVNWAPNNPRPAPGMIRFWTLEAFAHGASCVCYFRWRQAPFAQEQMHAGLLRVDSSKTEAWDQAEQVRDEIARLDLLSQETAPASVAILTGSEGLWVSDIESQAQGYDFVQVQLSYYSALRELGLNVDFISVDQDFSGYSLIIAPCLPIIDDAFVKKCQNSHATFVFGPRAGAKTNEFSQPDTLPPGKLQKLIPIRVLSVETLRPDCTEAFSWQDKTYESCIWREQLDCSESTEVLVEYTDISSTGGLSPAVVCHDNFIYIATLTDGVFLRDFLEQVCQQTHVTTHNFGTDIRVRQRGELFFAFNYSDKEKELPLEGKTILLGDRRIKPQDVTVWKNQVLAAR